jgi:hypothetical protein
MDYHHLSNITNTTTYQVNFTVFFLLEFQSQRTPDNFWLSQKRPNHLRNKLASTSQIASSIQHFNQNIHATMESTSTSVIDILTWCQMSSSQLWLKARYKVASNALTFVLVLKTFLLLKCVPSDILIWLNVVSIGWCGLPIVFSIVTKFNQNSLLTRWLCAKCFFLLWLNSVRFCCLLCAKCHLILNKFS